MFTGLIQALGTIRPAEENSWQISCVTHSDIIMQDLNYGDSIAVDGICLTVEKVLAEGFIVTASPETLRRTTITKEQVGHKYVNLEASLRVGSKLGGHFVMGHVDGVGQMLSAEQTASSWELRFSSPETVARYIVPKGSIAVNGISLTVSEYQPEISQFKVAVIPLTYAETNLRYLAPGDLVNLEGDILGKYVEKFLGYGRNFPRGDREMSGDEITATFLTEHGYL
jgi:riboflavin synthase